MELLTSPYNIKHHSRILYAIYSQAMAICHGIIWIHGTCTFPGNLAMASPVLTTASDARAAPPAEWKPKQPRRHMVSALQQETHSKERPS